MARKTASSTTRALAGVKPSIKRSQSKPRSIGNQAVKTRIIECEADIAAGVRSLRRKCHIMRAVHDVAGDPPLRRGIGGFEGLARIVVGQQLSVASASAIWGRTQTIVKTFSPARLNRIGDDQLRGAGMSRSKVKTLRAIADAIASKDLEFDVLDSADDETVADMLTQISGIGPWTADIYLMFCIGRADGWASGDLALQIAVQHAMELDEKPTAAELSEIAQLWHPWRGVAARLLWAYYAAVRQPKSGAPI